ncbi:MAG: response regulator transcription factor [Candidatus Eremiobacteraeota bacterium]|nr:response regulator transcription factor [Candidatus Eremiobacteraeota bacterium]MBC5826368.1 response regulator transcription factor [Candidatus Eremiobacteraeota bacterium]
MERIRIAIIEEQALFRKSLCHLFAKDERFSVIPECVESCAIGRIAAAKPAIAILDVDFHKGDCIDSIKALREAHPGIKLCLLSMHAQSELLSRALAVGLDAYVIKDISPSELARILIMVAGGDAYVDPRLAGNMLRKLSTRQERANPTDLSERETEVIRLIAAGLSNKQISDKLFLSQKTVKNHNSRIFSKLNLTARTQAAIYAIKNGIA